MRQSEWSAPPLSALLRNNTDSLFCREGNTKWEDLNLDDIDVRMKWAGMFHRRKRTPGKFMMRLKVSMAVTSVLQLPICCIPTKLHQSSVVREGQPEVLHVTQCTMSATAFTAFKWCLEAVNRHQAPARPGSCSATCAVVGSSSIPTPQEGGTMCCSTCS